MDNYRHTENTRDCPFCGKHTLALVGDGYDETYQCMSCHRDAGRFLQNTPERSGTAREAPSTIRNGTTVGPQAAAHIPSTGEAVAAELYRFATKQLD
jgi:hypothetical protein